MQRTAKASTAIRTIRKTDALIDPVHEYPHSKGGSVTGGYVYPGTRFSALTRKCVFADYNSRRVWALEYNPESGESTVHGSETYRLLRRSASAVT